MKNPREAHRMAVFVARCCLNYRKMKQIDAFFRQNELLQQIAESFPFVYEQPTRAFFFCKSTFAERMNILEAHMEFLTERLLPETVLDLYRHRNHILWEKRFGEQPLQAVFRYDSGQRKEGLASVMLLLNSRPLYQIIFWIAKDLREEWSLYIGAMQGPNFENARDVIKEITKKCHAYRTKNLVLYVTQALARTLGLHHIYAVTNEGYYANNHIRRDRKLKTSFSDFWMEAGGWHTKDPRFDELPLTEVRKTMEEISTHKRAVYRRRFALLDEIDATIEEQVKKLMK